MDRFSNIGLHIGAGAALLRGLAAFDAGGSANSFHPTASAILFVGGLFILLQLRRAPSG
ncbi:MAG: hypothetical protein AAGA56_28240 [Myxococcota bacterium]